MSLFIGNVANDIDHAEFETLFTNIGSCQVRIKVCAIDFLTLTIREPSRSSTSTMRLTLRRLSLSSTETGSAVGLFVWAGARRVAALRAAEAAEAAAKAASTVVRMAT
jgi:hypothetical protein